MKEETCSIFELNLRELTVQRLCSVAFEQDITPEGAIDHVVSKWYEDDSTALVDVSPESSYLDDVASKIDVIDKALDDVLLKLKRARI